MNIAAKDVIKNVVFAFLERMKEDSRNSYGLKAIT